MVWPPFTPTVAVSRAVPSPGPGSGNVCSSLHLLLSSLGSFLLAHLWLFRLHLPSRYTHHSLRVLLSLAAGLVLVAIAQSVFRPSTPGGATLLQRFFTLILLLSVIASPFVLQDSFQTAYYDGTAPNVYEYLQTTPKDSQVAGVDAELDNIPSFGQRPILMGLEYMIPYHWGYYSQVRDRLIALINAHYSPNPQRVRQFLQDYPVNYWLIRRDDFSLDYLQQHYWLNRMATSPPPGGCPRPSHSGGLQDLRTGSTPSPGQPRRSLQCRRESSLLAP